MRDRNGNWINFQYTNGPSVFVNWYLSVQAPTQITDSVGRTITINYNDSSCNGCTSITYPGTGGAARSIRIGLTNLSNNLLRSGYSVEPLNRLFPQESVATTYNFDPVLASYIQFPDNRQFTFEYDNYGELARVNLPTGGAIEYDYGDGQNGDTNGFEGSTTDANSVMVYRRLQQRREYAAGGSAFTAKTQYTVTYPGTATVDTDITYDATGNLLAKTVHTLDGSPLDALKMTGTSCNAWNEGLETQTDYGTPNPIATVKNTYATQFGCMSNPHLTTRLTILDDTNQFSEVTFSYDSYNNVAGEIDYDWGIGAPGGALRQTQTAYNTSSQYLNLNLVSLPAEVKILDGSNTLRADTQLTYDNGGLSNAPNIIGHDNQNFAGSAPRGNVTSVSRCLNPTNCTWVTTAIVYDIAGNAVSVTDPNNHSTAYSYVDAYSDGENRNTYARPTSVTNTLGQNTVTQYDYSTGKPTLATDVDGVPASYSYSDLLDRLTDIDLVAGGGSNIEAHSKYDYENPTWTVQYTPQTSGWGIRSDSLYDGLGRPSEQRYYEDGSNYISITETYDALGRIATVSNPHRPSDTIYYTSYTYDSLNRVTQVQTSDTSATKTTYSGNSTTVIDPAQHSRKTVNDALGRLTVVFEDPTGLKYGTNYGYDALDNLSVVSQGYCPNCQARSFNYDSLKRLISATNPESGTTAYSYDNGGNLTKQTDARGIATSFSYDALNRITGKTYSDGKHILIEE
jgi:YD repeat-containing protein